MRRARVKPLFAFKLVPQVRLPLGLSTIEATVWVAADWKTVIFASSMFNLCAVIECLF